MKLSHTALEIEPIKVGARSSKLSIKQIEEVVNAISYHYPHLKFRCFACQTMGDKDQKTSLRDLEKTDFFTREVDSWLLEGKCRIGIHSAKDLPDPIPEGLEVIAITAPLNSEDVIVFHPDIQKDQLPDQLTIATSSFNREKNVKAQIPQAQIIDLRGSIDQRIQKVLAKKADGAVIAKVALMRLGYQDLNMLTLLGSTTPLQGSLAIVARKGDSQMREIFQRIDSRKGERSLYTGLNPSNYLTQGVVIHHPLIQIKPYPNEHFSLLPQKLKEASHLLLTSQTSVQILYGLIEAFQVPQSLLNNLKIIAVGQSTAKSLQKRGGYASYIANEESQEGLMALFERMSWNPSAHVLYPRSKRARPLISDYFKKAGISFEALDFYETEFSSFEKLPDLKLFDELVFTSSSTVASFLETFKALPDHLRIVCKGKVTQRTTQEALL